MKDDNYWEDIETCLIKNYVVKILFKKCFTDDVITVHIYGVWYEEIFQLYKYILY